MKNSFYKIIKEDYLFKTIISNRKKERISILQFFNNQNYSREAIVADLSNNDMFNYK